jgi:hypothetical protein
MFWIKYLYVYFSVSTEKIKNTIQNTAETVLLRVIAFPVIFYISSLQLFRLLSGSHMDTYMLHYYYFNT